MLVFFTNLSLKEVQVRYSVLFCLFSITDSCGLFRMGRILKNIQLMLEFLRASFLVLHFSYYTLITFVMLSVILASNLNLISETLVILMWKWIGLFLRKICLKSSWCWLSPLNWIWSLTLSLLLKLLQENWSIDSFYKISFSWGCSISLLIYHMALHGILLSCLGWCSFCR